MVAKKKTRHLHDQTYVKNDSGCDQQLTRKSDAFSDGHGEKTIYGAKATEVDSLFAESLVRVAWFQLVARMNMLGPEDRPG